MGDAKLASFARDYAFLCKTTLNGPWAIDEFKREASREECCRRGRPEIYGEAERFILKSLKRRQV
jgi:hypothetical protein